MTTKFYQKSIDEVVKIFTTNLNEGLKKEEVTERIFLDIYFFLAHRISLKD